MQRECNASGTVLPAATVPTCLFGKPALNKRLARPKGYVSDQVTRHVVPDLSK